MSDDNNDSNSNPKCPTCNRELTRDSSNMLECKHCYFTLGIE